MSRTEELIAKAQQGDREASEALVEENSGLIWSVARRFLGRGTEADDLYQLGCLGFLKAVEGFDLSYGTQFSTYAVPKIAGEIRRFLRDDGAVKVSRSLKGAGRDHQGHPQPPDRGAGQGTDDSGNFPSDRAYSGRNRPGGNGHRRPRSLFSEKRGTKASRWKTF